MFTGIVEAKGEVLKAERTEDGTELWIRSEALADCEIGASVAISGVCLTVTERDGEVCRFDVIFESESRTTLDRIRAGSFVNIERPLRAGAELGGHIVQGHVDAVGKVCEVYRGGDGARIGVSVPSELARYVIQKGSVTIDGVSLTVTDVTDDIVSVALIPRTLEVTTLGDLDGGEGVNIEVDVLAKYVERLLVRTDPKAQ